MFPVLQDHLDEAGAGGGQGGPGGAGQPLPDGPAGNGHIGMGRHPGRRRILSFPVEAQPPLLLPQEAAGQAFVAEEGHGRPGAGKEDLIVRFENGDGMIGEIGDLDRGGKPRAPRHDGGKGFEQQVAADGGPDPGGGRQAGGAQGPAAQDEERAGKNTLARMTLPLEVGIDALQESLCVYVSMPSSRAYWS